jgi:hypothetical protein
MVFASPISRALAIRATNVSGGLSGGEIAGLVVGVIGLVLAALTVYIGWDRWKLGRVSSNYCML